MRPIVDGDGRRPFGCHRLGVVQMFGAVEHMAATPAAHPPVGDAKLIPHHFERGAAFGAAGGETHEASIVGSALAQVGGPATAKGAPS